ncbi:phage tail terminator protein [Methylomagnum sp.]
MSDYLALGPQIITELEARSLGCKVLSVDDLDAIDMSVYRGMAVFVAYAGEIVPEDNERRSGFGKYQEIDQYWLTIVAVQTAGKAGEGTIARSKAGPVLHSIGIALQGKTLGAAQLYRVTPPKPRYHAGYVHFPLLWRASVTIDASAT